ncbi:MAG: ribosomal RNA small subunit methyltransferase A [Candidatus Lokiarchaeota archaeon]|nr:ribosomal RNA small subunit methyltransferase A [Candidatus Lokiarchaeota archaeon]
MAGHIPLVFLTVPEIKRVLDELGQVPRKRHGQNFIHALPSIERILDLCGFSLGDQVLEIGPGLGAFTLNIARRAKHVHAIELNPSFAGYLQKRVAELGITNVDIQVADALDLDFPGGCTVLFSAMPYSISAPLTFKMLDYLQHAPAVAPARAFITCQKEFGEKLVAKPGTMDYGRIAANASLISRAEILMRVSRNNFYPVPDVDSVLVRLLRHELVPPDEVAEACIALTRGLFPYKNKVLRKAMTLLVEHQEGHAVPPGLLDALPCKDKRVHALTVEDLQAIAGWHAKVVKQGKLARGLGR